MTAKEANEEARIIAWASLQANLDQGLIYRAVMEGRPNSTEEDVEQVEKALQRIVDRLGKDFR